MQHSVDLIEVDGFHKVKSESRDPPAFFVFLSAPSCECDEGRISHSRIRAKLATLFIAVHPGQTEVEKNDVWLKRRRRKDRIGTIMGDASGVTPRSEEHRQHHCAVFIVVDH